MNMSGRGTGRNASPGPAGSVSPIPFPGFSPAVGTGTAVVPGRVGTSNATLSVPANGGRGQPTQPTGGALQHGNYGLASGRINSPLPPRPSSTVKPPSVGTTRFAGTPIPIPETAVRPAQPSQPSRSPTPPITNATTSPGSTVTPPAAAGNVSAGSKSHRKKQGLGSVSAQTVTNLVRTAEVAPAPRRKKRKPAEKQIPERVVATVPESAIYNQLVELEKRVDATLARKKLDIQEALRNPPRVPRTLRIYVTCSHRNQGSQVPDLDVPSWTLSISGTLLEEGLDHEAEKPEGGTGPEVARETTKTESPPFSTFLKRVTVELDPTLYPEKPVVSWEAARAVAPVTGFEIKRTGTKDFTARIQLELNYVPQRYQLSPKLAGLLGVNLETRPRIIAALWQYIKAKKLQAVADPTMINCDQALQEVFGEARLKMSSIASKLQSHLMTPPPISIDYPIRLSGPTLKVESCYDVNVDAPMPLQKEMSDYLNSLEKHRDIDLLDELIARDVRQINEHRKRRAFFLGFSQSPVDFVYGLMASQHRDLRQIAGETGRNLARERHSDFYKEPWVEDAVLRYLNRRPAAAPE